jgi:hypothetical protein
VVIGHCCDLSIYLVINGNMAVSRDHHRVIEKLLQTPLSSFNYNDKFKLTEEEEHLNLI